MKIYKYELEITDDQTIRLKGEPLSVINQRGKMCLYAFHDDLAIERDYHIHIAGTGHPMYDVDTYTFLGTVQLPVAVDYSLVFHVFYKRI